MLRTKKPKEDRPELLCSLNYLPQAERLTIVIMKARNLDTVQEPYVKVSSYDTYKGIVDLIRLHL